MISASVTRAIRHAYLLPCTPTQAALIVNKQCGTHLTGAEIERRWRLECEVFAPMRQMGERPPEGFQHSTKQETDRIELVRWMIDVTPAEKVA